ncbi:MAG: metallophosphoesterase [Lachnospiraceae bacterium]|nr:metallophosphoesterase [Lachnospiraceae bacterium]
MVDLYIYAALRSYLRARIWARIQAATAIILPLALIVLMLMPMARIGDISFEAAMWTLFAYASIYLGKYIFLIFDALSRLPILFGRHRAAWATKAGAWIGLLAFAFLWHSALTDKNRISRTEIEISIPSLPKSFDGIRIAQISDLHVGTFASDTAFVSRLVDSINAARPDIIVFTGDLVNRHSEEAIPFMKPLSRLHAPMGAYSIMGNHDYAEYMQWASPGARLADVEGLKAMQKRMGWKMLNNSTEWLRKGPDSIALIGVENIGDPPFSTYGDLGKAYPSIGDDNVKILLTHNPAHWTNDIADKATSNIALTLSGHTHAMQIMILGFSPARWRYRTWGGLYNDGQGQSLYVNRGAGEVGFPARIGATPEISIFTLKSAQK